MFPRPVILAWSISATFSACLLLPTAAFSCAASSPSLSGSRPSSSITFSVHSFAAGTGSMRPNIRGSRKWITSSLSSTKRARL